MCPFIMGSIEGFFETAQMPPLLYRRIEEVKRRDRGNAIALPHLQKARVLEVSNESAGVCVCLCPMCMCSRQRGSI